MYRVGLELVFRYSAYLRTIYAIGGPHKSTCASVCVCVRHTQVQADGAVKARGRIIARDAVSGIGHG